jgi:hypothetical protein
MQSSLSGSKSWIPSGRCGFVNSFLWSSAFYQVEFELLLNLSCFFINGSNLGAGLLFSDSSTKGCGGYDRSTRSNLGCSIQMGQFSDCLQKG